MKKNILHKIDYETWVTPQALADELGISVATVTNWIARKNIKSRYIPEFKKYLVDKTTITVRDYNKII